MLTFLTWLVIAVLVWRVESLAYKVEKLQRGQTNPVPAPKPANKPATAQNPAKQTPSIFEPLPETEKGGSPATAQTVPADTPPAPVRSPVTLDKLFSWIGGFVLLLGVVFCIKYSIEKNLISPSVRVALGLLFGVVLWGAGAYLRKENLKTTAHTLLACGLCVCYLTLFAAHHFYHLISAQDAFALLGLTAVAAFATAIWKKAFYVGILAQVIGFLTPFLLSSGHPVYWFLFGYGALITVSAVIAAVKCRWNVQIYVAAVLSALYLLAFSLSADKSLLIGFALLLAAVFAAAAFTRKQGRLLLCAFAAQIPLLLMLFADIIWNNKTENAFFAAAALWWVLFALVPLAAKARFLTDKAAWITSAGAGLLIGVLLQFIGADKMPALQGGWIPFLFALAYGGIFYAVYLWENLTEGIQRLRLSWLGATASFFIAVLICCALSQQWQALALAAEGTALICLWHKIKLPVWQTFGTVLLSVGVVNLFLVDNNQPITFLLNWYLYAYLIGAGLCFAGAYFWRETSHHTAKTYLQVLGGVILFALLNIEIASYFSQGEKTLSLNFCGQVIEAAAYTIAWALCGAGCLLLAAKQVKWLSKSGVVLIVLALLKLFLSDIWQLPLAARIIVSIAVAFILLGISFYYQQMRKQI